MVENVNFQVSCNYVLAHEIWLEYVYILQPQLLPSSQDPTKKQTNPNCSEQSWDSQPKLEALKYT